MLRVMVNAIIRFVRSMFNCKFRFFYVHARPIHRARSIADYFRSHDYVRPRDRSISFIVLANVRPLVRAARMKPASSLISGFGFASSTKRLPFAIEPHIDAPVITQAHGIRGAACDCARFIRNVLWQLCGAFRHRCLIESAILPPISLRSLRCEAFPPAFYRSVISEIGSVMNLPVISFRRS